VEGAPISDDAKEALEALFGSSRNDTGDDDIFGTPQPRAVGERWSINVEKMKDDSMEFDPQGASGFTRLVAVRQVAGVECLELEAALTIPRADFNTPEGAKLLESRMSGRFWGLFPTNTKLQSVSQGQSMDVVFKMEAQSPNGVVLMDATMHNEQTTHRD
jgi:hypothetical protein